MLRLVVLGLCLTVIPILKDFSQSPIFQSFNSLGQSPCAVAAHLQGVCDHGGVFHHILGLSHGVRGDSLRIAAGGL